MVGMQQMTSFIMIMEPIAREGAPTWVVVGSRAIKPTNMPAECTAQGFCGRRGKRFPGFQQPALQDAQGMTLQTLCVLLYITP